MLDLKNPYSNLALKLMRCESSLQENQPCKQKWNPIDNKKPKQNKDPDLKPKPKRTSVKKYAYE